MADQFFDKARDSSQSLHWTDLLREIADRHGVRGLKEDANLATTEALTGFVTDEIRELFDNPGLIELITPDQTELARLRSVVQAEQATICIPDTSGQADSKTNRVIVSAYLTRSANPDYYTIKTTNELNIAQAHLPPGFRSLVIAPVNQAALIVAARESEGLDPLVDLPAIAKICLDLGQALTAKNLSF